MSEQQPRPLLGATIWQITFACPVCDRAVNSGFQNMRFTCPNCKSVFKCGQRIAMRYEIIKKGRVTLQGESDV